MHSLCTHCALTMHYALCTIHYTLCIIRYTLCTHYTLYTTHYALYTVSRHTVQQHLTVPPLHTPPLYSLIHVDPRWAGAASTLSAARLCTPWWYAGLVPPLQCCALVQGNGGAIVVYGGGTITLSDCTFNKNTAVRNQ
jgi:hypothetical protein